MKKKVAPDLDVKALAKKVIGYLESTKEFALEQAPDICKQLILEAKIEATFDTASGLCVLIIGGGIGLFSFYKGITYQPHGSYDDGSGWYLAAIIVGGISLALSSCFLSAGIHRFILIKNCPKLFLLRQFRKLTR